MSLKFYLTLRFLDYEMFFCLQSTFFFLNTVTFGSVETLRKQEISSRWLRLGLSLRSHFEKIRDKINLSKQKLTEYTRIILRFNSFMTEAVIIQKPVIKGLTPLNLQVLPPTSIVDRSSRLQLFLEIGVLKNFEIKRPVLESLFNLGLKTYNFTKKRLQHRSFPVKISKFFRTPFLEQQFFKTLPVATSELTCYNLRLPKNYIKNCKKTTTDLNCLFLRPSH